MDRTPLVGVVAAAHRAVDARLSALEIATFAERAERVARLAEILHTTGEAEESVLFSALRDAVGGDVLVETCTADHSEASDRLETLARHPEGPGFAAAVATLAQDVRNHMRDETDALIPVLEEALGQDRAAALAADFERALARP